MRKLRTEREIIETWKGNISKPLVSICCAAYNHEHFIEDALEGFLIQETSFPFEILIHDDASTDNTADIIRRYEVMYPHILKPIYQTQNQYSQGKKVNFEFNFQRSKGKFIALCEGDDYWNDPLKIKKQVDFLNKHPNYSLCFTRFYTLLQKDNTFVEDKNQRYFENEKYGIEFDLKKFYMGWHVGHQTTMYRKSAINSKNSKNPYYRDVFLFSDLLNYGNGYCLQDFTAVYRIHGGGIYSGKNNFENSKISAKIYKEIYLVYKNSKYLKLKYIKFSNRYIHNLFKKKYIKDLFFEIIDRIKAFKDIWLAYYTLVILFSKLLIFPKRLSIKVSKIIFQQK